MGSTVAGFDRQSTASVDNYQREMPFLGLTQPLRVIDAAVVAAATFSGILADSCRSSGMDDYEIADRIHVCPGYMSRFVRTVGQQWARRLVEFCRVTQSLGPVQWMADQLGCDLVQRDRRAAEVSALRARLQELERAA